MNRLIPLIEPTALVAGRKINQNRRIYPSEHLKTELTNIPVGLPNKSGLFKLVIRHQKKRG